MNSIPPFSKNRADIKYIKFEILQIMSPSEDVKFSKVRGLYLRKYGRFFHTSYISENNMIRISSLAIGQKHRWLWCSDLSLQIVEPATDQLLTWFLENDKVSLYRRKKFGFSKSSMSFIAEMRKNLQQLAVLKVTFLSSLRLYESYIY